MPELNVEFSRVPEMAGRDMTFYLEYRNREGVPCIARGNLTDGRCVTFQLPERLARRSVDDTPPNDGDLVRIRAGSRHGAGFDAQFRLPEDAYVRLTYEPSGADANIRVTPSFTHRFVVAPEKGPAEAETGETNAKSLVFLPLFRGTEQLQPRLMREVRDRTRDEGRAAAPTPTFDKNNVPDLVFREDHWGIELRPESFGSLRQALSDGKSLWLLPAEQEVSENFKAVDPKDPDGERLQAFKGLTLQVLSIRLGGKTDYFWLRQRQLVHFPPRGEKQLRVDDLDVCLLTLAGPETEVRKRVDPDGVITMTVNERTARVVVDNVHPLYLVLDLGASTHLCGLHETDKGTMFLPVGPTDIGQGHAVEETPGITYCLSPLTCAAASINDPLWFDRGVILAEPPRDSHLRVPIGKVPAEVARERLSAFRALTDLKWLLHLAPPEDQFAGDRLGRSKLAEDFVYLAGLRCKAALEALPAGTLDPDAGNDAPLLALVVTLPGYLRCDIHEALLGHFGDLGSSLNRQTKGLTDNPEVRFGRVYLVPEPFALMAGQLEGVEAPTRAVITLDVGMRTFDAARVDRGKDGLGWFPRLCLSANLGGRAMDFAILAALREMCAPAERPAVDLLAIDDGEMLRRFDRQDSFALAAGEAMLGIVEAAKRGLKDDVLTFDFEGQGRILGERALGSLYQALKSRVEPGGRAGLWRIRWGKLAETRPMTAFMEAVGAMVDDCLDDLPEGGPAFLRVGGRGSQFPPLRRVIEARAGRVSGLEALWLDRPEEAKQDVIRGAARLAADRSLLVGRVEPTFFLVHLPASGTQRPLTEKIVSKLCLSLRDAGRVLVAAVGPGMARAIAESADPEALCRIFFQGESLEKALPVVAGEEITAEVHSPSPDGSQIVRLTGAQGQRDFLFRRPGGLFG